MPEEKARDRKNRIGTIGWPARSSQATKPTARRSPPANAATTSGLAQPASFPRMSPQTSPSAAPMTSTTPGTSIAVPGPKLSAMRRRASGMTRQPIGTLSQKIHCQETPSAMTPPSTGPMISASPVTPLKIPSAFPRSSGGNAALNRAIASGITSAAPAPWTARAAISHAALPDSAHATDAATNSASPATNMRRRPKRSPSAAPVSSSTAKLRL